MVCMAKLNEKVVNFIIYTENLNAKKTKFMCLDREKLEIQFNELLLLLAIHIRGELLIP